MKAMFTTAAILILSVIVMKSSSQSNDFHHETVTATIVEKSHLPEYLHEKYSGRIVAHIGTRHIRTSKPITDVFCVEDESQFQVGKTYVLTLECDSPENWMQFPRILAYQLK